MEIDPSGPLKPRLHAILTRATADREALVAGLSAAERAATGTADGWTAKDHLVHITAWRHQAALRLQAAAAGTPPPTEDAIEIFNAARFAEGRLRSWTDVLAAAAAGDVELHTAVDALPEVALADPRGVAWRPDRPLWTLISGNGYEHAVEHYTQFYLERGDLAQATAGQQRLVQTIESLFGRGESLGNVIYNLGCFYARTGQPAPAIAAVREALTLNPGLTEWSRQDADLDSLRADPAFQALYPA